MWHQRSAIGLQANMRLLATCYFRADQPHRAYGVLRGTAVPAMPRCTCAAQRQFLPMHVHTAMALHLSSLSQLLSGGVIGVERCISYCLLSSLTYGVFCGKIMVGTLQLQALRRRMRPADTCWRRPACGLGRCPRLRVLSIPTGCAAGCAGQLTNACLHQPCPCDHTTSAAHVHRS